MTDEELRPKLFGWHIAINPVTAYGENFPIVNGALMTLAKGDIPHLCHHGYHWSRRLIDAMYNNHGEIVSLVESIGDTWGISDKNVSWGRRHIVVLDEHETRKILCRFFSNQLKQVMQKVDRRIYLNTQEVLEWLAIPDALDLPNRDRINRLITQTVETYRMATESDRFFNSPFPSRVPIPDEFRIAQALDAVARYRRQHVFDTNLSRWIVTPFETLRGISVAQTVGSDNKNILASPVMLFDLEDEFLTRMNQIDPVNVGPVRDAIISRRIDVSTS